MKKIVTAAIAAMAILVAASAFAQAPIGSSPMVPNSSGGGGGGGGSPSGPASGDLGGSYPNPSVEKVNGNTPGGACVSNAFVSSISTSAVPTCTQPAFSNLSGQATLAQLPTIADQTLLGNISGGAAVPSAVTQAQTLTFLGGTTGTGALARATSPVFVTPTIGAATATTINGNVITAGTGTLTLGSVTLNAGAGGTLGSNAFTSTAYAPIASPTFTGTVTIPTPFTLGAVSVTSTGTQINYLAAATGTTGTASTNVVFSTSPTLVTPALGTPSAVVLTNATGLPLATGVTGTLIAGSFPALLGDITTSAGSLTTTIGATKVTSAMLNADVFSTAHSWGGQQTFTAPILGTPASGTLTNATGLPIASGVSGLATGAATFLGTPSSANFAAMLTDETGSGPAVFATSPIFTASVQFGTVSAATGLLKLANSASANLTTIQAGNAAAARTYTWPTNFGAAGTTLTDAAGDGTLSWAAGGSGLTIGTTAITSGTTTRLLYDLAGVVQESAGVVTSGTNLTITPAVNEVALTIATATHTSVTKSLSVTQTQNSTGTNLGVIFANLIPGASVPNAASKLLSLQYNTADFFTVDRNGSMRAAGYVEAASFGGNIIGATQSTALGVTAGNGTGGLWWNSSGVATSGTNMMGFRGTLVGIASTVQFGFFTSTPDATTIDVILTRAAAATLQHGALDAASPVAQTAQAQGSRAGTDTNTGGANFTVRSGAGTGTGTLSSLILQAPVAVGSGTGVQTQTTGLTIKGGQAVLTGYTVATLPTGITGGVAYVTDAVACTFLGALTGSGSAYCPVTFNGSAWVGF